MLLAAALVNGATFCTFTYLTPLISNVSGFSEDWVPAMPALYGLVSFAGVTIGGRLFDPRPMRVAHADPPRRDPLRSHVASDRACDWKAGWATATASAPAPARAGVEPGDVAAGRLHG